MPKKTVFSIAILAFTMAASAAYAQYGMPPPTTAPATSGVTRTILQNIAFPGDGYATVQAYNVIAPGATVARHTHPGIEVGYVLEGEGDFTVQGEPTKHLKAGESFVNPNSVPHGAHNTSLDKPLKVLSVYVVDKSKPLATAAPQ